MTQTQINTNDVGDSTVGKKKYLRNVGISTRVNRLTDFCLRHFHITKPQIFTQFLVNIAIHAPRGSDDWSGLDA